MILNRQKVSSFLYSHGVTRRLIQNFHALPALAPFRGWSLRQQWSESGEDRLLLTIASKLGVLSEGYYVDVGANLPTKRSNTFRLYLAGMRGVCLEPNLELACLYEKVRPLDQVMCVAAGEGQSIEMLSRFNFHVFSTCSSEEASEREARSSGIGAKILRTSYVPSVSLRSVLERVELAGRSEFFLLKTDTEGLDFEVLKSSCWERFRPVAVLSESTGEEEEVRALMAEVGYREAAVFPSNQLFLRKDVHECMVREKIIGNE